MGTPAIWETTCTVYSAPPIEYAALSFCTPFGPMSTWVSRISETIATFLVEGSTRMSMMESVRKLSPANPSSETRSADLSVPMSTM